MSKTIYITDGDALNIDRVVVSTGDLKGCKVFYSCDLIDEYEARLQAEKLAMLEEIRIKADELQGYVHNSDFWDGVYTYDGIIEAKIKNLKGEEDGKYND